MTTTVNQISELPPFSEPYLPLQATVATTNDTQLMHVPYSLGDKTARFFPTKITVRNKDDSTAVNIGFWDTDLDAPANTITEGARGTNTAFLFGVDALAANTEKIFYFEPGISGMWFHLGIAVKQGGAQAVDYLIEGYMQY